MSAAESYDFVDQTKQRRLAWALNDNTQSEVYASLQVNDIDQMVASFQPDDVVSIAPIEQPSFWSLFRAQFSIRQAVDGVAATTALFIAVICLVTH